MVGCSFFLASFSCSFLLPLAPFSHLRSRYAVLFCHDGGIGLRCGGVIFEGELSFGGVDDVVGHLLVAAEVVAGEFAGLAVYLHVGGGVDAVGALVPEEEAGLEGLVLEVLDEDSTTEFPEFLQIVEVSSVAGDEGIDLEGGVEALDEESFLEGPAGWICLFVDVPVFGDDLVADDAGVADEGADADALEGGEGVALANVWPHLLVAVAARG